MNKQQRTLADIIPARPIRLALICMVIVAVALVGTANIAFSQESTVTAEAVGTANVRTGPGIEFDVVGSIAAGTKYPVVGRSSRFPWLLIELPTSLGWVYVDLVTVQGDLNTVPYSDFIGGRTAQPTFSDGAPTEEAASGTTDPGAPVIVSTSGPGVTLTPAPVDAGPTADPRAVFAQAISETNVRYGPDINAPIVGRIRTGDVNLYPVSRRHSLYPWIEIFYPESPSQFGWVYYNGPDDATVTITGDLTLVEATTLLDFGYPTLTPTPQMVITAAAPFGFSLEVSEESPIIGLTEDIYTYLMEQGFVPSTGTQGSVFLHHLNSGEAMNINANVAYSGVSLMKIPVMVSWMRKFDAMPTEEQARDIANMMVCSDNTASNRVLTALGDGDANAGVAYVTETMELLGLRNTFISRTFFVGETETQLQTLTAQITPVDTDADQEITAPDPYNQTTAEDMGWLLAGIYQCAFGDPSLSDALDGSVTGVECRKIMSSMHANNIGSLFEAGIPDGTYIAHKHGWSDETHADAAIVMLPNNPYVLVMMMRNETWLEADASFPVFAEVSRRVYNTFEPDFQMLEIDPQPVPASCTVPEALVTTLRSESVEGVE